MPPPDVVLELVDDRVAEDAVGLGAAVLGRGVGVAVLTLAVVGAVLVVDTELVGDGVGAREGEGVVGVGVACATSAGVFDESVELVDWSGCENSPAASTVPTVASTAEAAAAATRYARR